MNEREQSKLIVGVVLAIGICAGFFGLGRLSQNATLSSLRHQVQTQQAQLADPYTPTQLLDLINKERQAAGVAPLKTDERLEASATLKLQDMLVNHYYDHPDPTTGKRGNSYIVDLTDNGCAYVDENLNMVDAGANPVTSSPFSGVGEGWDYSKPHHDAQIDPRYSLVGFAGGHAWNGRIIYVAHFCQPR